MTVLAWDQVGERRYETGVDRGVLYRTDAIAVPWNGLVSVTENSAREVKPFYLDGVRIRNWVVRGSYEGKIKAFTYPDELDGVLGLLEDTPGALIHDQRPKLVHLSYRTKIGNDVTPDLGYEIHVIYNVLVTPSDTTFETLSDTPNPIPFEWDLASISKRLPGLQPVSHISFDSRRLSSSALAAIEAKLYGTSEVNPTPLDAAALLDLAATS